MSLKACLLVSFPFCSPISSDSTVLPIVTGIERKTFGCTLCCDWGVKTATFGKTKFHMAALKFLHPSWLTIKTILSWWQGNRLFMTYRFIIQIYPIDACCCDWQLGLKATVILIQLRQLVGSSDNGLSSLPCFCTFSAVTETSLIASLLRQHPINLLNKVHILAVLFAAKQEDLVRLHGKLKGDIWGWMLESRASLITYNIRNLIAAVEVVLRSV